MAAVPGILRRWNPGILPGINVWLDSSDRSTINSNTEGKINSIVDKTANNTVLIQPNTPNKPSVGVDSGGRNILTFGSNLFLQTNNFPFNGPTSNFINVNVFTINDYINDQTNHVFNLLNTNDEYIEINYTDSQLFLRSGLLADDNPLQISLLPNSNTITEIIYNYNTNTQFNYINSTATNALASSTRRLNFSNSMNNFTLGRTFESTETTPELFKGSISEMVFYNKRNTNLEPLEGYLAWKWGLQSFLDTNHPYKYRPPS
jgi:hypothetical protein